MRRQRRQIEKRISVEEGINVKRRKQDAMEKNWSEVKNKGTYFRN